MLSKWSKLRQSRQQGKAFSPSSANPAASARSPLSRNIQPSPLVAVFNEIYDEYQRQSGGRGLPRNPVASIVPRKPPRAKPHRIWRAALPGSPPSPPSPVHRFCSALSWEHPTLPRLGQSGAPPPCAPSPRHLGALITTAADWSSHPAVVGYNQLTAAPRIAAAWTTRTRAAQRHRERCHGHAFHSAREVSGNRRGQTEGLLTQAFSLKGRPDLAPEINITPLVDVVLVLLLIFMLTAPVLQSGIEVAVPTRARSISSPKNAWSSLSTRTERLSQKPVNVNELPTLLKTGTKAETTQAHRLHPFRRAVPFGAFASVMDAVPNRLASRTSASYPADQNSFHRRRTIATQTKADADETTSRSTGKDLAGSCCCTSSSQLDLRIRPAHPSSTPWGQK